MKAGNYWPALRSRRRAEVAAALLMVMEDSRRRRSSHQLRIGWFVTLFRDRRLC
ncbi:hypothetical protein BDA96_04G362300 [Sorghum bicolor]|uniref:Uncharacterized protein n=1 Tax=Sorghum bicolor TaxID=4558 RepID=A0A921UL02_SORBI|nr:hypothetical protein BDA96_04G362300 [Sorghum bicolor]